jgi:MFS family permease
MIVVGRMLLIVLLGGLSFQCLNVTIQGMNPISDIVDEIYYWQEGEESKKYYGLASSISYITGMLVVVYPAYFFYARLGRLNSLRLACIIFVIGVGLMLVRHTAPVILGRAVMGFATGVFITNAMPYVVNCLPDSDKYFYGCLTIIVSRTGPLLHALTSLAVRDREQVGWNWTVVVLFPGAVALLALAVSVLSPYDSVECTWRRLRQEAEVAEYYAPVLGREVVHELCGKLRHQDDTGTADYPLRDYFTRPVLREKFLVAVLMILVRHWGGYVVYVAYLWYTLSHYYSPEEPAPSTT